MIAVALATWRVHVWMSGAGSVAWIRSEISRLRTTARHAGVRTERATPYSVQNFVYRYGGRRIARLLPERVIEVSVVQGGVTDEWVAGLRRYPSLRVVTLSHNPVGDVGLSKWLPGPELEQLDLSGTRVTDDSLPLIARCPRLVNLNLTGTLVTDRGVAELRTLTGLKNLALDGTAVHGASLAALRHIPMDGVSLNGCPVEDAALQAFVDCDRLESLSLNRTRIAGSGLRHLSGCSSLRSLFLAETHVTNRDLVSLRGLPITHLDLANTPVQGSGLRHVRPILLDLSGSAVTDDGLQHVAGVREFNLSQTGIGDASLKNLARPEVEGYLVVLKLRGTRVTFDGLRHLVNMSALQQLDVRDTPAGKAGRAKIHDLLPQLQYMEIEFDR